LIFNWELKIKKVSNGFILEFPSEEERQPEVIECYDEEKETMTKLLYSVYEHFASIHISENRYGNENLKITWDGEGRKYEPVSK